MKKIFCICNYMIAKEILEYTGSIRQLWCWSQELFIYEFAIIYRVISMIKDVDGLSCHIDILIYRVSYPNLSYAHSLTSYYCFRHHYIHWSIFPPSSTFYSSSFQVYYSIVFSPYTYIAYLSSYFSTKKYSMAILWLNYYLFRFTTFPLTGRIYY